MYSSEGIIIYLAQGVKRNFDNLFGYEAGKTGAAGLIAKKIIEIPLDTLGILGEGGA